MINGLRLAGFGLSLAGLTTVCSLGVGAQVSSGGDSRYACVQLDPNAHRGSWLRTVTADQACKGSEMRMLQVASMSRLFFADAPRPASRPTANEVTPVFISKILPTNVSVPTSAPILIAVTLRVDTDHGMYTIPNTSAAEGRGRSSTVDCVPIVDGQRAGPAQALLSNAEAVGARSASGVFDPRIGHFDQLTPGDFPDTRWSIRRNHLAIAAGLHEIAVACEAHAAFSFRGLATLIAMQQAQ